MKRISIICYSITALFFLIIGIQGIFLSAGDEMGYCLLDFYLIMPFMSLITSFIISLKKGYMYRIYPAFVGVLGMIIPIVVFKTFDWITLFLALVPALLGLIIGWIIGIKMNKK